MCAGIPAGETHAAQRPAWKVKTHRYLFFNFEIGAAVSVHLVKLFLIWVPVMQLWVGQRNQQQHRMTENIIVEMKIDHSGCDGKQMRYPAGTTRVSGRASLTHHGHMDDKNWDRFTWWLPDPYFFIAFVAAYGSAHVIPHKWIRDKSRSGLIECWRCAHHNCG